MKKYYDYSKNADIWTQCVSGIHLHGGRHIGILLERQILQNIKLSDTIHSIQKCLCIILHSMDVIVLIIVISFTRI